MNSIPSPQTNDFGFHEKLKSLTPTQFENLLFDLLIEKGMQNLIWRSPGADGGRDIEGIISYQDFCGEVSIQKWYVECKHYTNSVDWPTIFGKISYAKNHEADFLLLATSSKFSPAAISEVTSWNKRERLKIKLWPINQLYVEISKFPNVLFKYSLASFHIPKNLPFLFLLSQISSLLAAAEARSIINLNTEITEESKVAKELAWLLMVRQRQIHDEGSISIQNIRQDIELPVGYTISKFVDPIIDGPGLIAFLNSWRFITKQHSAELILNNHICEFSIDIDNLNPELKTKLDAISLWANFEYKVANKKLIIEQRKSN